MKKSTLSVGSFFVTLLLCLLALMSGLIAAAGTGVFRKTSENESNRSSVRTSVSYIENKVRGSGLTTGDAHIDRWDGGDVLVLTHGGEMVVYIYYSDGWLTEYSAAAGSDFRPELGERLIALSALSFEESGNLISVTACSGDDYKLCRDIYLYDGGRAQ